MARYLLDNTDDVTVVTVSQDDDLTYTTLIAQTYTDEDGIAKPRYAALGYDNPKVTKNAPGTPFAALTLVSGTARQDTTGRKTTVLIPITGGSAGTVKVEIGPTSAVANVAHPLVAANAAASQLLTIPLPALWFIKCTVVTAVITPGSQLG